MSVANESVTKQDLLDMEGRIVTAVKSYVDERSKDLEERIVTTLKTYVDERCERVETRLLTAFHGWARTMEIKVRGLSTITSGFDERLSFMEERLSQLERKAS
jgi:hypothetical protein